MEKETKNNCLPRNVFVVPIGELQSYSADLTIIGKAAEGWSSPDYVFLSYNGRTVTGYLKLHKNLGEKIEIEIVLNQIGCILDIPFAETIVVYLDSECTVLIGIVSVSVVQHLQERFVSFREMRDELYLKLISGEICKTSWIERWMTLRSRKALLNPGIWEVTANGVQEYLDTLNFAEEILELYVTLQQAKLIEFKKPYIMMLVFDLLVGQADRSPSNYGCIIDSEDKTVRFSPLFDNSTIEKPYIPNNCISLNQVLLERSWMAEICSKLYGVYFSTLCKTIAENEQALLRSVDDCGFISAESTRTLLKHKILGGIQILGAYI